MAFTQALLQAPREQAELEFWCEDKLLASLEQIGLLVDCFTPHAGLAFACDPFCKERKPNQYVKAFCDWSAARNNGEVLVEMRSGELMVKRHTRCEQMMQQFLELLHNPEALLPKPTRRRRRFTQTIEVAWPRTGDQALHVTPAPGLLQPHGWAP